MTKPFGAGELRAGIWAALLRVYKEESGAALITGNLTVELAARIVRLGEDEVHVTPTEDIFLNLPMIYAGKILTHPQLVLEVWG